MTGFQLTRMELLSFGELDYIYDQQMELHPPFLNVPPPVLSTLI